MNVPLFPAPPARDIRDVLDVGTSAPRESLPLPREFASRRRHGLLERTRPVSGNYARKKRNHLRKNLVHPRQGSKGSKGSKESGKGLRRHVTEFRLTMTERRGKEEDEEEEEEEDDADVVYATGKTFSNFLHFSQFNNNKYN